MLKIPKFDDDLLIAIDEHRGEPSSEFAPKVKTPLLVTDSKGYTLKNTLRACSTKPSLPFLLWAEVSAGTEKLVDNVQFNIGGAVRQFGPLQIYFWAGTCDVTKKVGQTIKLRYPDDQNRSLSVVNEQFHRLQTILSAYPEVTLKFVELPYITISKWNHVNDEETLAADKKAANQIDSINNLIRQLNRERSVNTLHFSYDCSRFRKAKRSPLRHTVNTGASEDGVHPTVHTSLIWIRKLQVDIYKTCYQDPDILDITVRSDDLNLLEEDANKAKSLKQ